MKLANLSEEAVDTAEVIPESQEIEKVDISSYLYHDDIEKDEVEDIEVIETAQLGNLEAGIIRYMISFTRLLIDFIVVDSNDNAEVIDYNFLFLKPKANNPKRAP